MKKQVTKEHIGKLCVFYNKKETKYTVSRLVSFEKGKFVDSGISLSEIHDTYLYRAIGGGLWEGCEPLDELIAERINFRATQLILE